MDDSPPDSAPPTPSVAHHFPLDFPLNLHAIGNNPFGDLERAVRTLVPSIEALSFSTTSTRHISAASTTGFSTNHIFPVAGASMSNLISEDPLGQLPSDAIATSSDGLLTASPRVETRDLDDSRMSSRVDRKPAVTIAPTLRPTVFKEKEVDENRSLGYIKAQRGILKYLDKHASDELTPKDARRFTEVIDPIDKYPSIHEALQLCYYMRSQGFDTYCRFDPKKHLMQLFVAVPGAGNPSKDRIYWEHNIKTGHILDMTGGYQLSRRHAISAHPQTFGHLGASLHRHGQDPAQVEEEQPSAETLERAQLLARLVDARQELEALVRSNDGGNEVRVTELITLVESLATQANTDMS